MKRLKARLVEIQEEGVPGGFECPTPVGVWSNALGQIRHTGIQAVVLVGTPRQNIAYRLQLLEFDCALLLLDMDAHAAPGVAPTLHATVSGMKTQQVAVGMHSVLEGIGSRLFSVQRQHLNLPFAAGSKVKAPSWKARLAVEVASQADQQLGLTKQGVRADLDAITDWRDRVHMDTLQSIDPLHFNEFTYANCFVPTYRTFRTVLTSLIQDMPDTCLDEVL